MVWLSLVSNSVKVPRATSRLPTVVIPKVDKFGRSEAYYKKAKETTKKNQQKANSLTKNSSSSSSSSSSGNTYITNVTRNYAYDDTQDKINGLMNQRSNLQNQLVNIGPVNFNYQRSYLGSYRNPNILRQRRVSIKTNKSNNKKITDIESQIKGLGGNL